MDPRTWTLEQLLHRPGLVIRMRPPYGPAWEASWTLFEVLAGVSPEWPHHGPPSWLDNPEHRPEMSWPDRHGPVVCSADYDCRRSSGRGRCWGIGAGEPNQPLDRRDHRSLSWRSNPTSRRRLSVTSITRKARRTLRMDHNDRWYHVAFLATFLIAYLAALPVMWLTMGWHGKVLVVWNLAAIVKHLVCRELGSELRSIARAR